MFASTSGRSILGFRIEPRSPPVQVTTCTSTPSDTYLAVRRSTLARLVVRMRVHVHQPKTSRSPLTPRFVMLGQRTGQWCQGACHASEFAADRSREEVAVPERRTRVPNRHIVPAPATADG